MRYSFSLKMLAKCTIKWKALHMRCIGNRWKPGGDLYNELLKGTTAQTMCAPATDERTRRVCKRKHGELGMGCELVLERPDSVEVC